MATQMTPSKPEGRAPAKATGRSLRPVEDIFDAMRNEIQRVFDRWGNGGLNWPEPLGFGRSWSGASPSMDVCETDKAFVVEAELPGVDEKDISITLQDGVLRLRGEKKLEREEKKENVHLSERSYGSFERMLRLPESADEAKVEAKFDAGVLTISIQKRAEAVKPERKIEIKKG